MIPPAVELGIQGTPSFAHIAQGGEVALLQAGGTAPVLPLLVLTECSEAALNVTLEKYGNQGIQPK